MFADRYLQALSTSNLQDDDQHHQTEPLVAAALADLSGDSGALFGTMLLRASIAGVSQRSPRCLIVRPATGCFGSPKKRPEPLTVRAFLFTALLGI